MLELGHSLKVVVGGGFRFGMMMILLIDVDWVQTCDKATNDNNEENNER